MCNKLLLLILLAFLSWKSICCDGGHCIWYGECGKNPLTHKTVNCLYNGTAKPLRTQKMLDLYKKYCPSLYSGPGTRTCCSDGQVQTMVSNFLIPNQLLSRCPSSRQNFFNLFCYYTCAADHSRYVYPNETKHWNDPATNKSATQILSVDFSLTSNFAFGLFNSCRDVQMPSINEPALSLLCGRPADQCTPSLWFKFMGDIGNSRTPFTVTFFYDLVSSCQFFFSIFWFCREFFLILISKYFGCRLLHKDYAAAAVKQYTPAALKEYANAAPNQYTYAALNQFTYAALKQYTDAAQKQYADAALRHLRVIFLNESRI